MKTSKKLLSVILSIAMIMTTISVCFVSSAAGTVSDANIEALTEALKNEDVANATYNASNNSITIEDSTGAILEAAKLYFAAFKECAEVKTGDNHTVAYRTSTQVKDKIATAVQAKAGAEDYQAYNMATVLNAFDANAKVNAANDQKNAPAAVKVAVKVVVNDSIIDQYGTLEDLPEGMIETVYEMSFTNSPATWTSGSGCNAVTNNYLHLTSIDGKVTDSLDLSALPVFDDVVNSYVDYFSIAKEAMVSMDTSEIEDAYSGLSNGLSTVINATSEHTVAHFFDLDAIKAVIANLEYAHDIQSYIPIVQAIQDYVETDFNDYSKGDATALYNSVNGYMTSFKALDQDVQDALISIKSFDVAAAEAFLVSLFDYIEVKNIEEFKESTADVDKALFDAITDADVVSGAVTLAQLNANVAKITSDIQVLNSYKAANVIAVCGEGYIASLEATKDHLAALIGVENYNGQFISKYNYYLNSVYSAINLDADSEELLAALQGVDEWYSGLQDFEAELAEAVGEETAALIVKDLSDQMHDKIDAQYELLATRVTAQINVANTIYEAIVGIYGETVVDLSTFADVKKMAKAFANVEVDAYNFLDASENYTVPSELKAKYEAIEAYMTIYNEYVRTGGFNKFATTTIENIIRKASAKDIVRNEDFVVEDADVEALMAIIDGVLKSDELGLNLSDTILGLKDTIYSDATVNALINLVFPMLTDLVIEMLTTMIPSSVNIPNDDNPSIPDIVKGKDVKIKLPNLLDVAKSAGLYLFPTQLADSARAQGFTAVADVLAQAKTLPNFSAKTPTKPISEKTLEDGTVVKVDKNGELVDNNDAYIIDAEGNYVEKKITNPWNDDVLYRTVVDEEGNDVVDEEGNVVKELALDWGIDGREDFVNALASVLGFLEPVLASLLGNDFVKLQRNLSTSKQTVVIEKVAQIIVSINFNINTLHVVLRVGDAETGKGANLYNDVLVPIFEILGLEKGDFADGKTFKPTLDKDGLGVASANYQTTKDMLNAILVPVEKVLDNVADHPVEFIADLLPNLAYALESGALMNLINKIALTLDVKLGTPADKSGAVDASGIGLSALWGVLGVEPKDLYEAFGLDMFIDGFTSPMILKIADLVDLDNLEINGQKLDLTLNGILNLVIGLLAEGITLPEIDGEALATLGELVQIETGRDNKAYEWGEEGKAAHIKANRADVLLYVLNYVLDAATQEGFIDGIIAAIAGEDGDPIELPAIVNDILANVGSNKNDAIAAIFELVNPKEYEPKPAGIEWLDVEVIEIPEFDPSEIDETIEIPVQGVQYSETWTKDQAMYIAENLPTFIDNIIVLTGASDSEGNRFKSLADLLTNLLNENVINPSLFNTIVEFLTGDDTIKEILGLITDLSPIDGKVYDFAAGDVEAFKAALTDVITVAAPILKLILTDENLVLNLHDGEDVIKTIELAGHNGYTNGLMPILEALGAADIASTAEFKNDIAGNIINPLMSVINAVLADPYVAVQKLIPNILYFIASDGVEVCVTNLLYAVNQILDVIRPIYDVNIFNLVEGIDLQALIENPVAALMAILSKTVEEATGQTFEIDFTAIDLFETLTFGNKVESKDADGRKMFRVENNTEDAADMITEVIRTVLDQVFYSNNATLIVDYLRKANDLSDEQYAFLYTLVYAVRYIPEDAPDAILNLLSYVFYGIDTGASAIASGYDIFTFDWEGLYEYIQTSEDSFVVKVATSIDTIYEEMFKVIHDDYTREKLDDFIDKLPVDDEDKENVNFFLDFFRDLFSKIKELFDKIFSFFKLG